ncbi:hypothetical protein AC249_AIPGENE21457 [Exaiptasia diaphana]|nr:hypothetical protein AC249_AIPGENE21457 [Exaiptasia diaphana]
MLDGLFRLKDDSQVFDLSASDQLFGTNIPPPRPGGKYCLDALTPLEIHSHLEEKMLLSTSVKKEFDIKLYFPSYGQLKLRKCK